MDDAITANDVYQLKKSLQEVGADVTRYATATAEGMGNLSARILELEQRGARGGIAGGAGGGFVGGIGGGSLGATVANHGDVRALIGQSGGWRGRLRIGVSQEQLAAITTVTAGATRDVLVAPDRLPGLIPLPQRRFTIRSLLAPGRTTQNSVQFTQETAYTDNAAVVSEGALKPESDISFELKTVPVATIAHFIVASKQILDDAPMLQSHIDGRLRYGVSLAEETQLLHGDGTGVNLLGMIPQATGFASPIALSSGSIETRLDILAEAISQSELALLPATGIILNLADWRALTLLKDSQGRYLGRGPFGAGGLDVIWDLPCVPTPAMTAGHFLVGAFGTAAQIYDREDANVELSTEDSDNFRRNLVSLRGEERLALAVFRPAALIYGSY